MTYQRTTLAGLFVAILVAQAATAHAFLLMTPERASWQQGRASPAQGHVDEGLKALNANDLAGAEAAFAKAAGQDRALPSGYIGLAEVAGRKNRLTEVEAWLQKALAANPDSVYAHVVWGHYQFQRRQFGRADVIYKKALALDARSVEAHVHLAENYLRGLKKPLLAEMAFRAALALDAHHLPAHLGLAAALAVQQEFEQAVAAYEQAAIIAPTDPSPPHLLARLYASRGEFDLAQTALQRSIAIAPDYLPAHVDRGDLYLGQANLDKAVLAYRAGALASRRPAIAYFKLGAVLEGQQRWTEAEQAYLAAVQDDPLMYAAYNNLAFMAAVRKERLDEALVWAKKATEIAPRVTDLLDTLGWVHHARGELGLAAKAIERAVATNPRKASFRYHLGVVYVDQGKKKEAVVMLKNALALDNRFYKAEEVRRLLQQISAQ